MPGYRADGFDPPAPFAWTTVRGRTGLRQSDVPFLIDTGSDLSVIPRSAALAVDAPVFPSKTGLQFFDGSRVESEAADLTIELLRFTFSGLFVVSDETYGVIGRDILNNLTVTFDGPNLTWSA